VINESEAICFKGDEFATEVLPCCTGSNGSNLPVNKPIGLASPPETDIDITNELGEIRLKLCLYTDTLILHFGLMDVKSLIIHFS
jgi:hypothetical protein